MRLWIDFETRSECPLKKTGAWRYAEDESTQVICLGIAWSYGPKQWPTTLNYGPKLWLPPYAEEIASHPDQVDELFVQTLIEAAGTVVAHNYDFERAVWEKIMVGRYGWPVIPDEKWSCTLARSAARNLPRSLEESAIVLGVTEQKDTVSGRLVQRLCKPTNKGVYDESPEKYRSLYDYCLQDVRTTKAVDRALPELSDEERGTFLIDAAANRRGVQIDRGEIERIVSIIDEETERGNKELSRITEGAITSHGQAERIAEYCGIPDCTAASVAGGLEEGSLSASQRRVLQLRQRLSKSSTKKFQAMLDRSCKDQRIRGILQYHGASTGRWAGRGIQPQNFPRWPEGIDGEEVLRELVADPEMCELLYGDLHSCASWALRSSLKAAEGLSFFCGDFASIEGRVLAWYAKEQNILDSYARGLDMYKVAASSIYNVKYEDVTKPQRFVGKVAELALGYQGYIGAFLGMASNYGVDMQEQEARDICNAWRDKREKTVKFWYDTAKDAILARGMFSKDGKDLVCTLPSGRHMVYPDAEVRALPDRKGKPQKTLTFMTPMTPSIKKHQIVGIHPKTKKYVRISTYGGCLVENIVQATARDLLVEAMKRSPQFPIVFTVHDEIVAEAPKDRSLEEFLELFSIVPDWAHGIPIKVDGWKGERYRK